MPPRTHAKYLVIQRDESALFSHSQPIWSKYYGERSSEFSTGCLRGILACVLGHGQEPRWHGAALLHSPGGVVAGKTPGGGARRRSRRGTGGRRCVGSLLRRLDVGRVRGPRRSQVAWHLG